VSASIPPSPLISQRTMVMARLAGSALSDRRSEGTKAISITVAREARRGDATRPNTIEGRSRRKGWQTVVDQPTLSATFGHSRLDLRYSLF